MNVAPHFKVHTMITSLTLGKNQDGSGTIHIPKEVYKDFLKGEPLTKISGDCHGVFRVTIKLTRPLKRSDRFPASAGYDGDEDGTSGQDRKSYSDNQDRKSYT